MLYLAQHHLINPGSSWWWGGIGILFLQITIALQIGKKTDDTGRALFEKGWGLLLLVIFIGMNVYRLLNGEWRISDSLPLQMCGISHLLAIAALLFRQKWAFYP